MTFSNINRTVIAIRAEKYKKTKKGWKKNCISYIVLRRVYEKINHGERKEHRKKIKNRFPLSRE